MAVGRGFRHLRMAVWDAKVFRAVRGAGISPVATGDRGHCPMDPCNFLKKLSKTFISFSHYCHTV